MWWLWNPVLTPQSTMPRTAPKANNTLASHGVQSCCSWTPEEGFHHFSENWLQITGLIPGDCRGNGWSSFWMEDVQNEFAQLIRDLFHSAPEDRIESAILQGEMQRGESSNGWFECLLVPVGPTQSPQLTILVTDKSHEHQLRREAAKAIHESGRARLGSSSFLSNMSHELRTPLNAILGFAQLLDEVEGLPTEARKEYTGYIRDSGELLLQRINDLIEMAAIESSRCTLDEMAFSVKDTLDVAVEMNSHKAFSNDQIIRLDIDHPHLIIRADRAKWLRCLNHVIGNAIEHNPESDEIIVQVNASQEAGMMVKISDSGTGISNKRLSNIQSTLQTSKSWYATDISDVGIGLAVTKELMQLHNGRLDLQSDKNRGTTAILYLPAERVVSLSAKVKHKSNPAMKVRVADKQSDE